MKRQDGDDIQARLKDIERAKQQRVDREQEKRQRAEAAERKNLQQGAALAVEDWDMFDLKQTIQRAEIRVKEGRGSPMDIWYNNLNDTSALVADSRDPSKSLKRFSVKDLEAALQEAPIWLRIVSQKDFWIAIQQMMKVELAEAKEEKANVGRLHEAVSGEVEELLGGKTYKELIELEAEINQTLGSGAGVDVDYWEMLLRNLTSFKYRARAAEIYQRSIMRKLAEMPAPEQVYMKQQMEDIEESLATARHAGLDVADPRAAQGDQSDGLTRDAKAQLQRESEVLKARSAALVASTRVLAGKESIHSERELYVSSNSDIKMWSCLTCGRFEQEASRPCREGDEPFNQEVPLPPGPPGRRKPLFFNRVHMGFEWNKYNQMHYDADNPPPKVVQGYKFNLFYPDLKDKSRTPSFSLEPENSDNQIIVFRAGEPYADVAFRIVNRDWDKAQREGYKSSFERGVLHLWFVLKRFRYRR